jgi:hypothetical protein
MSSVPASVSNQDIDSTLRENRVFPPPAEFSARAHIQSLEEYESLYKQSIENPEKFWAEVAMGDRAHSPSQNPSRNAPGPKEPCLLPRRWPAQKQAVMQTGEYMTEMIDGETVVGLPRRLPLITRATLNSHE